MKRAVDYIEKNIHKTITVDQAARAACISKDHFWRLFKDFFHETVGCYIRKRKLTLISTALVSSKRDIGELAGEYGFESREAFSRAFKRQFRTTPAVYRRNSRNVSGLQRKKLTSADIRGILSEKKSSG
jgi:AraC-like DNA-binding protein